MFREIISKKCSFDELTDQIQLADTQVRYHGAAYIYNQKPEDALHMLAWDTIKRYLQKEVE